MDIIKLDSETQKVLDAIEVDEYFERINKYLQYTFYYILTYIKLNKYFELDDLDEMCAQSRNTRSEYIADIIKLLFLGYISVEKTNLNSDRFVLGSKKIFDRIKKPSWDQHYFDLISLKSNYLKLSLNSKINSVNGMKYLTRYKGETIEDIFKKDPDYIVEKIDKGNFILDLQCIKILEQKYTFKFPVGFKEFLKTTNLRHSTKVELLSSGRNFFNTIYSFNDENKLPDVVKVEKDNFLSFLDKSKYTYSKDSRYIHIENDFNWDQSINLIDNININGNLKVNNFLENPRFIPTNLNVSGYIQFCGIKPDVWLKID